MAENGAAPGMPRPQPRRIKYLVRGEATPRTLRAALDELNVQPSTDDGQGNRLPGGMFVLMPVSEYEHLQRRDHKATMCETYEQDSIVVYESGRTMTVDEYIESGLAAKELGWGVPE